MNKVVLCMSMSLDGFIAAADDGPGRGLGVVGEPLHAWLTDGNDNPDSRRPGEGLNAEVFDDMKSGVRWSPVDTLSTGRAGGRRSPRRRTDLRAHPPPTRPSGTGPRPLLHRSRIGPSRKLRAPQVAAT